MGYLDYAGLHYLWGKLKEKFAPNSHSHDDRYYTEAEMDGKLNSKVDNNETGVNGLLSKLTTSWTATPTDNTYFIRQDTGGKNSFGRVKFSTLWTYIKGKTDGIYQPKGSYAASSHTHDDRYYTESEMNTKLSAKAENIVLASDTNLNNITTPGFYSCDGGNKITNKPNNTDAIGLIVTHNASGGYYTQILTTSSNANTYRRTCLNGSWSGWTQDKYTDTNTWRGIQNNLTSDSTSDSLSAAQGKALKTLIDGKAANEHTHQYLSLYGARPANINFTKSTNGTGAMFHFVATSSTTTGKPPADSSILQLNWNNNGGWDSQLALSTTANPHVYYRNQQNGTWGNWSTLLDNLNYTDYTAKKEHTHTKSQITDFPASLKNPTALTIQTNGAIAATYDGSAAKTVNITKGNIGLGNVDNTADANKSVKYANSAGTANVSNSVDWSKVQNKPSSYAPTSHNHDSRYYTESEIDSKLDGKSNVGHTHDYLPTAGGTMNGTIAFSDYSHGKIYSGPKDNVNGPGGDLNNIVIESWNGLSFTTGCPNQTYTGKTAVGIDCREGVVKAARFDGTLTGTAAKLGSGGNPYAPMTFNWSGKDGQPTWVWGGEDGTNMYVYNPGNFSVNWAHGASNGVYANGFKSGIGGYIRFCNGLQICWGANNKKTATSVFDVPFKTVDYTLVLGGSDDLSNAWYIASRTTTGFTPKQNGFAVVTNWIAIGRWI